MTDFQKRYVSARRAVIAKDLSRLNPMQREGAMATEGPLLLLAGAGSGKTTVLIQRIYNLLTYGRGSDSDEVPPEATEDDLAFLEAFPEKPDAEQVRRARSLCALDVPKPWEILAITFTNKAAGELKDRLERRLGEEANDIWASTFHSACVRILRRDVERLGFARDFTIYDTDDAKRVVKDVLKELELDEKTFPPKSVLNVISAAKDRDESPEAFAQSVPDEDWRRKRIAKVYARYQEKLRKANALDFDDLIYHTVDLLRRDREVREYYQRKFRYVLVDEYQDTNHLQYLLTSLLAGGYRNLCVVGDDDQSIYRFRGANIENILGFEAQYPDARLIRLEQNYRSTQNILDAANAVIAHNVGRKGKTLWTKNGSGALVSVRTVMNETDEANGVVSDVLASVRGGHAFRDAAVLYRMNAQSNTLELALRRNGIPYKVVGGMKFFERAEVKDMLAYLCVVNNPMDDLRLRRIVNQPARGIGAATLERAETLALAQGVSLYEIMRNADLFPELKGAATKLLSFADLIDSLRKQNGVVPLPELYDALCEKSGYVQALKDKDDMESRGRLENVEELKSSILSFTERGGEDATLSGFLNEIALYTDLDSVSDADECVTLMTIHAAKGLEFPIVYVVGMEEGIFPGANAIEQEDLEEERRLCYVAMTRAKEKLTLTCCRRRTLYGRTSANPPSRFLNEIPSETMRWEGRAESSFGMDESDFETGRSYRSGVSDESRRARPTIASTQRAAPAKPMLQIAKGDRVEHTAFGGGTVLSVRPMGGDALVEVAFDASGTKKLMLRAASAHMKKL